MMECKISVVVSPSNAVRVRLSCSGKDEIASVYLLREFLQKKLNDAGYEYITMKGMSILNEAKNVLFVSEVIGFKEIHDIKSMVEERILRHFTVEV